MSTRAPTSSVGIEHDAVTRRGPQDCVAQIEEFRERLGLREPLAVFLSKVNRSAANGFHHAGSASACKTQRSC